MSNYTPIWRIKVNGYTVTDKTLTNLTITSGRQTIYEQPAASYAVINLICDCQTPIPYQINDTFTIEVTDSNGDYSPIFGGSVSDISATIQRAGTIQPVQYIQIIGVGALARLVRATFTGNLGTDTDGDQIYELLSGVLFDSWQEVPGSLQWQNYEATTTWEDAENSGLGEIDQPGNYDLHSQNNLNDSVYSIAAGVANSGLGYLYEDSQGRIGYADSTHRATYLSANGYVDLNAQDAVAQGLQIVKRAGDVRNKVSVIYGISGNAEFVDSDPDSIALFGELASVVTTTLKNQNDAEDQAEYYLKIRAYPQFQFQSITFPLHNPEIDDTERDALLNVFMGMPVNIQNLPPNWTNGEFQGFVEGWTWRAGVKGLSLELIVSPVAFSLQAFRWNSVPGTETWNTISPTLDWLNATIVA